VDSKLDWEQAHRKLAVSYLEKNDLRNFVNEMNVVIDQYPFVPEYYIITSKALVEKLQFEAALPYLLKYYTNRPDAFSSKWIGIIQLSNGKVKDAVKYLEQSARFNNSDPQVLYNLAGAYALNKEYQKALEQINRTLELEKNNQDALNLQKQLIAIVKNIEAKKTN
jgi:tetratricopeptide (TPR) repeat protein